MLWFHVLLILWCPWWAPCSDHALCAHSATCYMYKCAVTSFFNQSHQFHHPVAILIIIITAVSSSTRESPWCHFTPSCCLPAVLSACLSPSLHDVSLAPSKPFTCACVCVCVFMCACACACAWMHVCTPTHTHTHIWVCVISSVPTSGSPNLIPLRAIYSCGGPLHTVWHVMTCVPAAFAKRDRVTPQSDFIRCVFSCLCLSVFSLHSGFPGIEHFLPHRASRVFQLRWTRSVLTLR